MKGKTFKKVLATLLAASMCVPGMAFAEEETKNYWEMLDEVSDTSELPDGTGEILEVSVWVAGGTDAIFGGISDTNVTFKELERVTGIRFNIDDSFTNGGDSVDSMLPRVVASKNFPTMIMGYDMDEQFNQLYENGYLKDLTQYYENGDLDQVEYWIPHEYYEKAIYRSAQSEDGNYFLIPYVNYIQSSYDSVGYAPEEYDSEYYSRYGADPYSGNGLAYYDCVLVRDDILKALYPDAASVEELQAIYLENGEFTEEQVFDVPLASEEDFYNFLYDVKELLGTGEFTGLNGKEVEVTYGPNSETDNWSWMNYWPRAIKGFKVNTDYFVTAVRDSEDGQLLQRSIDTEEFQSWMRSLNTLLNDDVISQNSLVDNATTWNEKLANGQYAVVYGQMTTPAYKIDGSEGGWSYRPIWINTPISETFGGFSAIGRGTYYGIFEDSLTEEQTEQLVHAINYLYSKVGTNNFIWGPASAGLFETDEEGNRSYVNEAVADYMMNNTDNGAGYEYGLRGAKGANENAFDTFPLAPTKRLLEASYLAASEEERKAEDALKDFNPDVFAGLTPGENQEKVISGCDVYGLGAEIEGLQEFWNARTGYENQMKKTIAATPDKFDAELENLIQYAEENGLTAETVTEFNDLFVETNRAWLETAGLITAE